MAPLSQTKISISSRNYYRRNKQKRLIVHKCPHCSYETTGPKQSIKAHIWSKHTPENERPFQCPHPGCNRGFASWATLNKHTTKHHNTELPSNIKKQKIIAFIVINILTNKYNRIKKYKDHKIINMKKLINNEYSFSLQEILYDDINRYIILKPYTRNDILTIINNK